MVKPCIQEQSVLRYSDTASHDKAGMVPLATRWGEVPEDQYAVTAASLLMLENTVSKVEALVADAVDLAAQAGEKAAKAAVKATNTLTDGSSTYSQLNGETGMNITGLTYIPGLSRIELRWALPTYERAAETVIYQATTEAFENAVVIKKVEYPISGAFIDETKARYYWVQLVDKQDPSRHGQVFGPIHADPYGNLDKLVETLRGKITATELDAELVQGLYKNIQEATDRTINERLASVRERLNNLDNLVDSRVQNSLQGLNQVTDALEQEIRRLGSNYSKVVENTEKAQGLLETWTSKTEEALAGVQKNTLALTDANTALSQTRETLLAKVGANEAAINKESEARTTQYESIADDIKQLRTKTEANEAAIVEEGRLRSDQFGSQAETLKGLQATSSTQAGRIRELSQTVADNERSSATKFENLKSGLMGNHHYNYNFTAGKDSWEASQGVLEAKTSNNPSDPSNTLLNLRTNVTTLVYSTTKTAINLENVYNAVASLRNIGANPVKVRVGLMTFDHRGEAQTHSNVDSRYYWVSEKTLAPNSGWASLGGEAKGATKQWPINSNLKLAAIPLGAKQGVPVVEIVGERGSEVDIGSIDLLDISATAAVGSEISHLKETTTEAFETQAKEIKKLNSKFGDNIAEIEKQQKTQAEAQKVQAEQINNMTAKVGKNEAGLQRLDEAVTSDRSSTALALDNLKAGFNSTMVNHVKNPSMSKDSTDWTANPTAKFKRVPSTSLLPAGKTEADVPYYTLFKSEGYVGKFWGTDLLIDCDIPKLVSPTDLVHFSVKVANPATTNLTQIKVRINGAQTILLGEVAKGKFEIVSGSVPLPANTTSLQLQISTQNSAITEENAIIIAFPQCRTNAAPIESDAKLEHLRLAVANADQSLAREVNNLQVNYQAAAAAIKEEKETRASETEALSLKFQTMESEFNGSKAKIQNLESTVTTETESVAKRVREMGTEFNGKISTVTETAQRGVDDAAAALQKAKDNLGLAQRYADDKKREAIADAAQAVQDNLKLGGRNLLIMSRMTTRGYLHPNTGAVAGSRNDRVDETYYQCKPGEKFVGKIYGLTGDSGLRAQMAFYDQQKQFISSETIHTSTVNDKVYKAEAPQNAAFYRVSVVGNGAKAKLERGTIPTDWSPAPEDVEDKVDKVKVEIERQVREAKDLAVKSEAKIKEYDTSINNAEKALNRKAVELTGQFNQALTEKVEVLNNAIAKTASGEEVKALLGKVTAMEREVVESKSKINQFSETLDTATKSSTQIVQDAESRFKKVVEKSAETINRDIDTVRQAAADAASKADQNLQAAQTYADGKKTEALDAAKQYADNQKTAAIEAAATDATQKANAVKKAAEDALNPAIQAAQRKADEGVSTAQQAVQDAERNLQAAKEYAESLSAEAKKQAIKDAEEQLKQAKEFLQGKIAEAKTLYDNLEFGGRNLIRKSNPNTTDNKYLHTFDITEAPAFGSDVIVSLWGDLGTERTAFAVYNSRGFGELAQLKKVSEGVYQAKFKWADNTYTGPEDKLSNTTLNLYAYPSSSTSAFTINKVKFERGTVPTDWTPAPEDVEGKIDEAKQKADGIKTDLEQAINQARMQLETKISEVEKKAVDANTAITDYKRSNDDEVSAVGQIARGLDGKFVQETQKIRTEVTQAIDDIQIGGRNLAADTYNADKAKHGYLKAYRITKAPAFGDKVTVTVWGELGDTRNGQIGVYNTFGYGELFKLTKIADGVWRGQGFWNKHTSPDAGDQDRQNETLNLYAYPNDNTDRNLVNNLFTHVKFELGNKPTDWTPAPEDLESKVETITRWKTEAQSAIEQVQRTVNSAQGASASLGEALSARFKEAKTQTVQAARKELEPDINAAKKAGTDAAGAVKNELDPRINAAQLKADEGAREADKANKAIPKKLEEAKQYADTKKTEAITEAVTEARDWKVVNARTDLNTLKETGRFFIKATPNPNAPINNWLYVAVDKGADNRITQKIQADNDPNIRYYRYFNGSSWTDWVKEANLSDVNAVDKKVADTNTRINNLRVSGRNLLAATRKLTTFYKGVNVWHYAKHPDEPQARLEPASSGDGYDYTDVNKQPANTSTNYVQLISRVAGRWVNWHQYSREGSRAARDDSSPTLAKIQSGRWYTFSCEAKKAEGSPNVRLQLNLREYYKTSGFKDNGGWVDVTSTEWQQVYVTVFVEYGRGILGHDYWLAYFEMSDVGNIQIRKPMLVEANIPADWSEAPEDLEQSEIQFAADYAQYKSTLANDRLALSADITQLKAGIGISANLVADSEFVEGLSEQAFTEDSDTTGYVRGIVAVDNGRSPKNFLPAKAVNGVNVGYVGRLNEANNAYCYFGTYNVPTIPGIYQYSIYVRNDAKVNADVYANFLDESQGQLGAPEDKYWNKRTATTIPPAPAKPAGQQLTLDDFTRVVFNIDTTHMTNLRYTRIVVRLDSVPQGKVGENVVLFCRPQIVKIKKLELEEVVEYTPGPSRTSARALFNEERVARTTETESLVKQITKGSVRFPNGTGDINQVNAVLNQIMTATANQVSADLTKQYQLQIGGANLIENSDFKAYENLQAHPNSTSRNKTATIYQYMYPQAGTMTPLIIPDVGLNGSNALRVSWTEFPANQDKGLQIVFSKKTWARGQFYILAVAARLPAGVNVRGCRVRLDVSNAPFWQDVEYLNQPELTNDWQWTICKARKTQEDNLNQLFISVNGANSPSLRSVEFCLPYASQGVTWGGYKPPSISALLTETKEVALDAQGKVNAKIGMTVDAGGRVIGWEAQNRNNSTEFTVLADKFQVKNSSNQGGSPFTIENGEVIFKGKVRFSNVQDPPAIPKVPITITAVGVSNHLDVAKRVALLTTDTRDLHRSSNGRGVWLSVINNQTGALISNVLYDTYTAAGCTAFANAVNSLNRGSNLVVVRSQDASMADNQDFIRALNSLAAGFGNNVNKALKSEVRTSFSLISQVIGTDRCTSEAIDGRKNPDQVAAVCSGLLKDGVYSFISAPTNNSQTSLVDIAEAEADKKANAAKRAIEDTWSPTINEALTKAKKGVEEADKANKAIPNKLKEAKDYADDQRIEAIKKADEAAGEKIKQAKTDVKNDLAPVINRAKTDAITEARQSVVFTTAQDLNSLTNSGSYVIKAANNPNAPITNWLFVTVEGDGRDRILQTVTRDNNSTVRYTRRKVGGTWSDWAKEVSADDVQQSISALKIPNVLYAQGAYNNSYAQMKVSTPSGIRNLPIADNIGIAVQILNISTLGVEFAKVYPANATSYAQLAADLSKTAYNGKIVMIVSRANVGRVDDTNLRSALRRAGSTDLIYNTLNKRGNNTFALIGKIGSEGSAQESIMAVGGSGGVFGDLAQVSAVWNNGDLMPGSQTLIDGGRITTNSITANQISVGSLSAISANLGHVTAGSINIGGKFKVDANGDVTISSGGSTGLKITNQRIDVYDEAARLRVRLGKLVD
jgi:F0F1-type ATP synthase membrane subunit b/b'|nr:MAG TPA: Minor structural protein 4 [Caudoviricetes sp.]